VRATILFSEQNCNFSFKAVISYDFFVGLWPRTFDGAAFSTVALETKWANCCFNSTQSVSLDSSPLYTFSCLPFASTEIMQRLFTHLLAGFSLAAVFCLFVPYNDALAAPSQGWVSTATEGGSANLRATPSTRANIVSTLRNGANFNILGERFDAVGYRWYRVQPTAVNLSSTVWLRSDLISFAAPYAAQPRLSCDGAIAETETSLRAVTNTRITSRAQRAHGYTNGPASRPNGFSFILAGSGGSNILASPVMMNRMAAKLIENCADTGLVTFSVGETDGNYVNYGAMPERLVRPFQCSRGAERTPVKWGEQICL
jgi:hypothetical protein